MRPLVTIISTLSALVLGLVLGRSTRRAESPTPPPPAPLPEPPPPPAQRRTGVNPWTLVAGGVFIVFGLAAGIYYSYILRSVIVLILVALLLAIGLQGPVVRLRKLGLPRPIGLLTIYVAVIAGLVLAGVLLLPPVVRDIRELADRAPAYFGQAQAMLGRFGVNLDTPALEDLERRALDTLTSDIGSYAGRLFSILNFTFGLLGGVLNALLVLVLSIFFVTEGPKFRDHLLSLMAPDRQERWHAITLRIARKIQGWMLGTLFLGLILWAVTTVSLLVLGMPYAFLLGLLAGVGEFIPMIGPIIAAIPAVAVAAFQGWGTFALVLGLYVLIQQLENYVLVPRVMGGSVDLPGLGVLIAFLIGSELYGVLGAILATPVAAVIQVLWLDWIVPSIREGRPATPVGVEVNVRTTRRPASDAPRRAVAS